MARRVLVRPVPSSYPRCLRTEESHIDLDRARQQHADYQAALAAAGLEVVRLPELPHAPDSVFVEDTLVVFGRRAVITRPGAPSRRVEVVGLALYLEDFETIFMEAPAKLDGGDVLRIDRRLFVGLSARTNREGMKVLESLGAEEVVPVPVGAGLHLKSVCSRLGTKVIGHFDRFDATPFLERGIELIPAPDELGANVLDLDTCVLVSAAAPKTAELIGERARVADVGEFHKGDGALTCLSVPLASPRERS
jgi:dimethylargininase